MRHVISTRRVPNPDVDGRPQDTERAREEREGCRLWPLRPFLACKGTRRGGRPAARPSEPSLRAAARAARAMTMYIRVTCVRCVGVFFVLRRLSNRRGSARARAGRSRTCTRSTWTAHVWAVFDFLLLFQCFQLMLVVVGVSGVWWCGVFRCCACYVFFCQGSL